MAKHGLHISMVILMFCGCARAQCVPGGFAVVVNNANPVESLSMAQLRKLILGDVRAWQDHKNVALVARDSSTKDFQCALSAIVRLSVAEFQRYIISAEFRGDEPCHPDRGLRRRSGQNSRRVRGGLAIVEANSLPAIGAAVKVIRIEGKALGQPGYPL